MRIFIGMPIYRYAEPQTNRCVLDLLRDNTFEWRYNDVEDSLVHQARNRLAVDFVRSDCDSLLFVDSDMVFEPSDIVKLNNDLVADNLSFVSALAFAAHEGGPPCVGKEDPKFKGKFRALEEIDFGAMLYSTEGDIDVMGMGVTLINRSVFKQLSYPWFENITSNGHANGEDYTFCIKAKEAGIPFACDTTVRVGHIGKKVYGYEDWKPRRPRY